MHLQPITRSRAALIFLFAAATSLFAASDTLGPFIWQPSLSSSEVYVDNTQFNCNPTVDGAALPYGSIIAAVDSLGRCIGAHKWTPISAGAVGIAVMGYDSTTPPGGGAPTVTPGMKPGQKYRFVIWDTLTNKIVTSVYAHFGPHNQYYGNPNADSSYIANSFSWLDTLRGISPPSAPVLSAPANAAGNQALSLNLTWGSVATATTYEVQVSTSQSFSPLFSDQPGLAALTATVSGLATSTTYYWQVNAVGPSGTSSWSGTWSFSTVPPAPGVPLLSTPAPGAVNQAVNLSLSWSSGSGSGVVSYSVQVSNSASFTGTTFAQSGITGTTVAPTGLVNNTTYYWRASATNLGGSSAWSAAWSFGVIPLAPTAPVLSSPANAATNQAVNVALSWTAAATAVSYGVQVSTDAAFGSQIVNQTGITGTTLTPVGLGNNVMYYWRANATNAGGTSAWGTAWSFTTTPTAAANPLLTAPANGATGQLTTLTLSWASAGGVVSSYTVQVSTVATFATISYTLNGASLLSASPTGLAYPGVTYYWRAGAVNAAATSWSSTWSFVTLTAPAAPALSYPGNAASVAVGAITATWAAVPTATAYTIQVSTGSTFSTTTLSQSTGTATSYLFTPTANKWNYWKVSATNQTGVVTWSAIWSFISGTSVLSSHDAAAAACDFSMKQGAISYSLPKAEQVEISICDMLGRTAMSISNRQAAGSYSVDLRSSALASGEYVVRFKAGAFEKQNTLMLAR